MISPQQTKDQERAKAAWDDVVNCLPKAIAGLEQRLREAEQRHSDRRTKEEAKNLRQRLEKLRSEEGGVKFRAAYGRQAQRLPTMIQTNGLGQTSAFLRAKGKGQPDSEHQAVYSDLSMWVTKQMGWANSDLLLKILESDSAIYRRATAEALAFALWLRRFAEAELPSEEGGE